MYTRIVSYEIFHQCSNMAVFCLALVFRVQTMNIASNLQQLIKTYYLCKYLSSKPLAFFKKNVIQIDFK